MPTNTVKPIRIERSRKHKQVSPNSLEIKYVGRPTKYGNPLKLVGDMIYIDAGYRRTELDKWVFLCMGDREKLLRLFRCLVTNKVYVGEYGIELDMFVDLGYWVDHFKQLDLAELKGKNLSCWCSLSEKCHADVLLHLANQ